ncbi:MAG TPA: SsrA-binding protein SmpB [Clostridiaceae bacterium]|nr:SsrA-binding protein SmpB [Clostridiaceae bacterium]
MNDTNEIKLIARNRRAFYEYEILSTLEAGIVLSGTEVKSLRQNHLSFADSWVTIRDNEAYLIGMHITPYEQGNRFNVDPVRDRKLLLNKHEIRRLEADIMQKGLTIVPTKIYFRKGFVKLEIGLAKGKKLHDKRRSQQDREVKRAIESKLKEQRKGY